MSRRFAQGMFWGAQERFMVFGWIHVVLVRKILSDFWSCYGKVEKWLKRLACRRFG